MKLFTSTKRKEWNENHKLNWKSSLKYDKSGFSIFQNELLGKLENVLENFGISSVKEITEHKSLDNENIIVKMITLTLDENSKFWIYHDMAELDLVKEHQIYEEWGYLKPEDLINEFIKSTMKLIRKIKK
jgi:hypothetical protein